MISNVKKIGVLRANALGDFILTLPAFDALRNAYPEAEIILLGRDLHQEFYGGRPGPINRVIAIPRSIQFDETMEDSTEEKSTFLKGLQEEKFDLLIQLHGGGKYSNKFLKQLGAKITVGAKVQDAPELDVSIPYTQFQHETLRQLEIVETAGANGVSFIPHIEVTGGEREIAQKYLEEIFQDKNPLPFVLLNPGARDPKRRWPLTKFIEVSEFLLKKGYRVLFNVSPAETEIMYQLKLTLNSNNVRASSPDLRCLPGVVHLSSLVISNDTGTLHLAGALNRPSIGLFWYVNLLNYGPITARTNRVLISWEPRCPLCKADSRIEKCEHSASLLSGISSEQVMAMATELLQPQS